MVTFTNCYFTNSRTVVAKIQLLTMTRGASCYKLQHVCARNSAWPLGIVFLFPEGNIENAFQ